jgi:GTPase
MASSVAAVSMEIKHPIHPKKESLDAAGYSEFYVAVIGSVDSSKSSTVGVLTNPGLLDDGNGKARAKVFKHPHERESGRTSDISYQYVKDEEAKRIITFIDLAGHEQYLHTTINGLSSGYPDMALVCISDKITKMTREHMGIAIKLGIPILILFTKTDLVPKNITDRLVEATKKALTAVKRRFYQMRTVADFELPEKDKHVVPFIMTSNKTGSGIDLVRHAIRTFPKSSRVLVNGFSVEHIYTIQGYGTVVSGMVGEQVRKGDTLYIGPLSKGDFYEVKVKSLHNDFRFFVDELSPGSRGCLCINLSRENRGNLRPGMILSHTRPKNICKRFLAEVEIFHHSTTIKPGYQAYINCGMIREAIKFITITKKKGEDPDVLRSGETAMVELEFMRNLNYIEPGQMIIFREGNTRGVGKVTQIFEP